MLDLFTKVEIASKDSAFAEGKPEVPERVAISSRYAKGRVSIHGLRIAIEQPRGSARKGKDRDGTEWSCRLAAHYGYFIGTKGADGDGVDVFVGPNPDADIAFVINQNVNGRFDEHKVVLGAVDEEHARTLYRASYAPGWRGLSSVVTTTIPQLKQWLRHGNKRRALTADHLNQQGTSMNRVFWNRDAQPEGLSLDQVLYRVRIEDSGDNLLMDSVSMTDIIEDSEGVLAMDAMVVPVGLLNRKMDILKNVMERAGSSLKPLNVQVSEPFKQRGVTNVAALFELSDGQSISVYFHNPDATPNKLAATDDLISWKWLLNKKDITIVVAPERGADLNPREVAKRIMRLAEKNSAAFQRVNAKRAERMSTIQNLKGEIAELEGVLAQKQRELEAEQILVDERSARPIKRTAIIDPASPEGYAQIMADEALQLEWQDALDALFNERIVETRNALRKAGWTGEHGGSLSKNGITLEMHFKHVGAGKNVVGAHYTLSGVTGFYMSDSLVYSPEELAGKIDFGLPKTADPSELVEDGEEPDEAVKIAAVDAAYQFDSATDEFKLWLYESLNKESYSPFVSAKVIDAAAKRHGATVEWGEFEGVLDGVLPDVAAIDAVLRDEPYAVLAGMAIAKSVLGDVTLDDATHAIATLQIALDIAENNEPINRAEGNIEQADLELEVAASFREALEKLGAPVLKLDTSAPNATQDDEGEDFDEDAEWDAIPEDDEEPTLDGDFAGHPFRGNQYRKGSLTSGTAVRASIHAKRVSRDGSEKEVRIAHRIAHHSHLAASLAVTSRNARRYHRKLARLHAKHAGVDFTLDDAGDLDSIAMDSGALSDYCGKVRKGGEVVGRVDIGGDGKAMIFVGATGSDRVTYVSRDGERRTPYYSDDAAGEMVDWLFETISYNAKNQKTTGEGNEVLELIEAMRQNRIAKIATSDYFTVDINGDDVLFTDEMRAMVEGELGEKLVETVLPGLEAQVTLVPESQYMTTATPTADATTEAAAEAISQNIQLESDKTLFQSVIDGTVEDILSPSLADELEGAYLRHEGNAEIAWLFEQAVNAYQAAMLRATASL